MSKSRARLTIILALSAVCAGCVSSRATSYPGDWSPLRTGATDCHHLTGVYDERPIARANENSGLTGQIANLSPLLDRGLAGINPPFDIQRVELSVSESEVRAFAFGLSGEAALELKVAGRWRCLNGQLHAAFENSNTSENDAFRTNKESVRISITDEGDLVAEVQGRSSGLSIIPYSVGGSYWNLYRRARR
jgi:hypothetical protein